MATALKGSDVLVHDSQVVAAPYAPQDSVEQSLSALDKLRSLSRDKSNVREFTNADGVNIHCRFWAPSTTETKALLCIVHGYADHCMRFAGYGEEFSKHGILVFAQDLAGFGRSGARRGPADDLHTYVRDVVQHTEMMRAKYEQLPIFIYGHSLGAVLAINAVLENRDLFRGLIVSGSNCNLSLQYGKISIFMIQCLGRMAPSMTIMKSNLSLTTRDETEIEKIRQDPLIYKETMKFGFVTSFIKYLETVKPRLGEITLPIFITHGELDVLAIPENANYVYESVSSTDKSVEVWRGCKHSLQHELEPERSEVLERYVQWILDRL